MRSFLEELAERVLVCDGAMGTMLYAQGVFVNQSFDALNSSRPDLVETIHRAYREAGADVLETNTFGANRPKLESFGLGDQLATLNTEAVRIARRAAGPQAFVAGAIGPLGMEVQPDGRIGTREAEGWFREQAQVLADAGVDLFVLETFRALDEMSAAIRAVRAVCDRPVVAQMTTTHRGDTADGHGPEAFAVRLEDEGASVVGVNCGTGLAETLETLERLRSVTSVPLAAQPNAGFPRHVEGRTMYMASPQYMASYARRFTRLGVRLLGGCCGTTPDHIREMATAVSQPIRRLGAPSASCGRPDDAL